MWQRADLKQRAKDSLKGSYWQAFLVSIILIIANPALGGGGSYGGNNFSNGEDVNYELILIIAIVTILIGLAFLCFRIFLGFHLEVGVRKYFIKASERNIDLDHLGYSFREKRYVNILKTMLLMTVYLMLWLLLFVIPGIVKSYAYAFVPYILADNPNLSPNEAITLSRKMTDGHKFNMFVLDLSFLGWKLLGLLACCVGILFVNPYYNATFTELYLFLRAKAIEDGIANNETFCMNIVNLSKEF